MSLYYIQKDFFLILDFQTLDEILTKISKRAPSDQRSWKLILIFLLLSLQAIGN